MADSTPTADSSECDAGPSSHSATPTTGETLVQEPESPDAGLPPGYVGRPELVAGYPVAVAHYALPPIDTSSGNPTWRLYLGIAVAFVAAVSIFLTSAPTLDRTIQELPTGSGTLSQPISFYEVSKAYERPCSSVEDALPAGSRRIDERGEPSIRCYELIESSRIEFDEVSALLIRPSPGSRTSWEMTVTLTDAHIEPFRALTTTLVRTEHSLAVIYDGRVLSATNVPEPVTNGTGLLFSGLSKTDAQKIFLDLRTS